MIGNKSLLGLLGQLGNGPRPSTEEGTSLSSLLFSGPSAGDSTNVAGTVVPFPLHNQLITIGGQRYNMQMLNNMPPRMREGLYRQWAAEQYYKQSPILGGPLR